MFAKTLGRKVTVCAALLMASIGTAQAAYWVDRTGEDEYNTLINGNNPFTYTHYITDWGSGGYRPGIDTITDARLTIALFDDSRNDAGEWAKFRFDSGSWRYEDSYGNGSEVDGGPHFQPFTWDFFVFEDLAGLLSDGMLSYTIKSIGEGEGDAGDFRFAGSRLDVWGDRGGGTSVPEPTTLSLLGLGLLGLGFAARRRKV